MIGGYSNEDDVRNTFQQWVHSFMKEADEAEVSELSQVGYKCCCNIY